MWLITGSSTGFGRALAQAAKAQGDRVIAISRNVGKIQYLEHQYPQTAKAVRLAIGPNALPMIVQKLSSDIEGYKRFEDIWQASTANGSKAKGFPDLSKQV